MAFCSYFLSLLGAHIYKLFGALIKALGSVPPKYCFFHFNAFSVTAPILKRLDLGTLYCSYAC